MNSRYFCSFLNMKWWLFWFALVVVCLREGHPEPKDNNGEEVHAEVTDVPVFNNLLLVTRTSADPTSHPSNNSVSLSVRFEKLMSPCGKDGRLVRASAWDGVMVVAVVAVSLAEARLLSATFTGFQLLSSDEDGVKSKRLSQ